MFLLFSILFYFVFSVELTFELKQNEEQCFFQDLNNKQTSVVEFQVTTSTRLKGY